jgi:hypothetical protein
MGGAAHAGGMALTFASFIGLVLFAMGGVMRGLMREAGAMRADRSQSD